MIAAMKQNAFNPEVMQKAPSFSGKEINKLADMNAKMSEFYNNLKMSAGKLVVEFMPEIVSGMNKISESVKDIVFGFKDGTKTASNFAIVIKVIKDLIMMAVEGWGMIFKGVDGFLTKVGDKGLMGAIGDVAGGAWDSPKEMAGGMFAGHVYEKAVIPSLPASPTQNNKKMEIKQNFKFGGDQDPVQIKQDFKNVMESTFRQMNLSEVN